MKLLIFFSLVYCWCSVCAANSCSAEEEACKNHDCPEGSQCRMNPFTCKLRCACDRGFQKNCDEELLSCLPGSCHINANCEVRDGKAVCVCKPEHKGHPVTGCDVEVRDACMWGDPHYTTFDRFKANYHGSCPVILTQNRHNMSDFPDFQVVACNKLVAPGSKLSWMRDMEITVYSQTLRFIGDDNHFYFNDVKSAHPYYWPNEENSKIRILMNEQTYTIETQHNLQASLLDYRGCVYLPEVESLRGEQAVMGLFGNIDDNMKTDMICKDGSNKMGTTNSTNALDYKYAEDFLKCQDSFITTESGFESTNCVVGVDLDKVQTDCNTTLYENDCGPINEAINGTGPFALCKVMGESAILTEYNDCTRSMCGGADNKCKSFNSFAMRCHKLLAAGVSLGSWRSALGCKIECQPNSVYNKCSSACPRNCAMLDYAGSCTENCVESCECLDGYVLDNTESSYVKCVKIEQCGCKGPQEKWHPANKTFLNDDCTLSSICSGGHYTSKNIQCSNDATCSVSEGVRQCICNPGFTGDGYTCIALVVKTTPTIEETSCLVTKCKNGGVCVTDENDPSKHRCQCPRNFGGSFCDDVNEGCDDVFAPCHKNARCQEVDGIYKCKCKPGFKGDGFNCTWTEEVIVVQTTTKPSAVEEPSCLVTKCKNGGVCITDENDPSKHRCQCPKNFGGSFCDDLNEGCDDFLCHEHAQCAEVDKTYKCKCKHGYKGDGFHCTMITIKSLESLTTPRNLEPEPVKEITPVPTHNICATKPCKNSGLCLRDQHNPGTKFACACRENYAGLICDELLECGEHTCGSNALCSIKNNKINCVCKKGYAGNPFKSCGKIQSACIAQDPHIRTFDGLEVDYHGTCPYLFTSSCGKSIDGHTPFQAVLKNKLSDGDDERYLSWVYEAEIELFNQTIHMDMYSEELSVNQVKQNAPFYWPDSKNPKITILFRARIYSIKTDDGLEFSFGNNKFCAFLPEIDGFKNPEALCGVAGNMDGKWENDVFYRNGSVLTLNKQDYKFDFSYSELQKCQDTWITTMKTIKGDHTKCQTSETLGLLYNKTDCDVEIATQLCHPISQAQSNTGPFAICSVMGEDALKDFYQDCIHENCPNTKHLCRELKAFAAACREALPQDTDMGNWREECGCETECPVNSVYSTCKSACPETCAENGKTICNEGCVEGCRCIPGYVLDNTASGIVKCIKKEDCGCTDEYGNWHRASKSFLSNNCLSVSKCENGTLTEKSHECGRNAQCVTAGSQLQCICKFGFAGDGYNCNVVTKSVKPQQGHVTCYPGWSYCKLMNKCYKYFNESPVTFEEGKELCASRSGEPVSINFLEELRFLIEMFASKETSSAWIGLQLKAGEWEWVDGTKAEPFWSLNATKTNECGQVNLCPRQQDYLDADCNSKAAGIICEDLPIMSTVCET